MNFSMIDKGAVCGGLFFMIVFGFVLDFISMVVGEAIGVEGFDETMSLEILTLLIHTFVYYQGGRITAKSAY